VNRSVIAEKRGLSPVIATVILISVTIVVAVSVAYWMGSIASGYTTFEQIELPTVYAKYYSNLDLDGNSSVDDPGWKVTIALKNTGSADATVDDVFLNGIPLKDYSSGWALSWTGASSNRTSYSSLSISVTKGNTVTLYLYLNSTVEGCSSGTTIDIKIHTASGRDYPTHVKLP